MLPSLLVKVDLIRRKWNSQANDVGIMEQFLLMRKTELAAVFRLPCHSVWTGHIIIQRQAQSAVHSKKTAGQPHRACQVNVINQEHISKRSSQILCGQGSKQICPQITKQIWDAPCLCSSADFWRNAVFYIKPIKDRFWEREKRLIRHCTCCSKVSI